MSTPDAPSVDAPPVDLDRLAHRAWSALDTVHVAAYFAAEPAEEYAALGLRGRAGYFYSRAAPMGAVPPEVVAATFYVFAPGLIGHVMREGWTQVSPEQMVAARQRGVGRCLDRVLETGPDASAPDVTDAIELVRELSAGFGPHGRALYAGHASLEWPTEPLVALWHGASLLREYRGDAHMAALLLHGLDPVEALLVDAVVTGRFEFLTTTRGFTAEEFAGAEAHLRERGLLDGPAFTGPDTSRLTEAGTALRATVDETTRLACLGAWQRLGPERADRLGRLVKPLAQQVVAGGVFPAMLKRG